MLRYPWARADRRSCLTLFLTIPVSKSQIPYTPLHSPTLPYNPLLLHTHTHTHIQIALLMYERALKRKLLDQLQLKYAKRNLAKPDYGFTLDKSGQLKLGLSGEQLRLNPEDITVVERRDLLPWMVGVPSLFDSSEIYRTLIGFKYQLIRYVICHMSYESISISNIATVITQSL
jgi:hypothetical protein